MDLTVEMFRQEISEAVKGFEKYIVCLDKTPEECEEAIERFSTIDAGLEAFMRPQRERHGITTDWVEGHLAAAIAAAKAKG